MTDTVEKVRDLLMFNLPGPRVCPARYIINFQKGATAFFMVALMTYYQNFSTGCYLYLALHGSYGFMWLLKELAFNDKSWETVVTLGSGLFISSGLVGYWMLPVMMANGTGIQDPTHSRILTAIVCYVIGVVFMMTADAQKYFTLKYKKGLISEGMFKLTRNPNYFGEILVYLSFAIAVGHTVAYAIPASIWCTVFAANMYCKEKSYARKAGWDVYKVQSYILLPRLFKSHILNLAFYGGLAFFLYRDYEVGGYITMLNERK